MHRFVWKIFFLILSTVGCASGSISILTNPSDAEVYVVPISGGNGKLIGKTPLNKDANAIVEAVGGKKSAILRIKKQGYETTDILVTDLTQSDLSLSKEMRLPELEEYKLKTSAERAAELMKQQEDTNFAIDILFEAQRLIRDDNLNAAEAKLKESYLKNPSISATQEMLGGIYFMRKNYKAALRSYELAILANPANASASRMKSIIENLLGIEKPEAIGSNDESDRVPAAAGKNKKKSKGAAKK